MIKLRKLIKNNSDIMLCEVMGYRSHSKLIEDGFSGKISQRRFEVVLEDYFRRLDEASLADVLLTMLSKAVQYAKTTAIKALGAFAAFLKKIIQAILTFKEKHPVIFWALVAIIIMLVSAVLSSAASAQVKAPSGQTLNADHVNAIIGSLQDIVSKGAADQTSDTATRIGQFQKALLTARDNPNVILDLSKDGFFKEAFQIASNNLMKTGEVIKQHGGNEALADYVHRLITIGKTMVIQ